MYTSIADLGRSKNDAILRVFHFNRTQVLEMRRTGSKLTGEFSGYALPSDAAGYRPFRQGHSTARRHLLAQMGQTARDRLRTTVAQLSVDVARIGSLAAGSAKCLTLSVPGALPVDTRRSRNDIFPRGAGQSASVEHRPKAQAGNILHDQKVFFRSVEELVHTHDMRLAGESGTAQIHEYEKQMMQLWHCFD